MAFWRRHTITLDEELMTRIKRYAELAGYSSPREFIEHTLEKQLAALDEAESDDEIKRRLRGLGYIS